jgi:DNA-binding response OmpR family regulator
MKKDTIIVVDDEPSIRRAVARHVRDQCPGYTIVQLRDGVEALQALSPKVALIITDVNMPRLSGFELCRSLREAPEDTGYRDLPVILLTALDSENDVATSWDVGSTLHISKPFEPDKLDAAIRQVLGI